MSYRVLVVDDDFRVAALHRAFVERVSGFEVVAESHTGSHALATAEEHHPDLVLLDLYLPDLSGLEVLKALGRVAGRPIHVMVITAARDVASVAESVRSGALSYLVKPLAPSVLTERLEACAAMRPKLDALGEASQDKVDEIYATLRTSTERSLPKGQSRETLGVIVETLRGATEELSAEEVAARSGVSRATAQRYLSHLARMGRIELVLRYGTGRPEHRYRWPR
jgi:response regulator of citrate/malate metabolism